MFGPISHTVWLYVSQISVRLQCIVVLTSCFSQSFFWPTISSQNAQWVQIQLKLSRCIVQSIMHLFWLWLVSFGCTLENGTKNDNKIITISTSSASFSYLHSGFVYVTLEQKLFIVHSWLDVRLSHFLTLRNLLCFIKEYLHHACQPSGKMKGT